MHHQLLRGPLPEPSLCASIFLPSPEDISQSLATVKVTMYVGARSLDFYKTQSKRMKIPYQRLIRTILDDYARQYSGH